MVHKDMNQKPELLVPLNDCKTLYEGGCVLKNGDAFYFGLQNSLNMRTRAGNFNCDDVEDLVEKVHAASKKLYLCTNTIIYNDELDQLRDNIKTAKNVGVDGVICHDMAAIEVAKSENVSFHVSTQANISNVLSANYYSKIGAERLILARELNLTQIKEIVENTEAEIEIFIHGAMCTAISGRCYFSAEVMGFDPEYSANRGRCIQPCRRMYEFMGEEGEQVRFLPDTGMFFNAKDLCMIEHIDKVIATGVHSLKIEGRMRNPRYIATVARCYREAIDAVFSDDYSCERIAGWKSELEAVFNRGFHTGFYLTQPSSEDVETKIRGNVSKVRRRKIGIVKNYYRKAGAVEVELTNGNLKIGNHLVFENQADFYYEMTAESMQIDGKSVQNTDVASADHHIVVGIKADRFIPRNSQVYVL